ncbi:MAG: type II toxin-antitoxin system VapC family toxin [Ardenticatenaceae bacterium]|nr:type II toxin-antitoxin system VapC family toxin [Anaerolineales bacterium]MCB8976521.1 type II toxin-antitoxin system VapC family toxin [Ardenticatenaceae bacterium]
MIVLDASALLAFLFQETGQELVAPHLEDCCLSTVNLSEVVGRFVRDGHDAEAVLNKLLSTQIEIVPFSAQQAGVAALLLPLGKSLGLSLADRACMALAMTRNVPVLTADAIWQELDLPIEVNLIR